MVTSLCHSSHEEIRLSGYRQLQELGLNEPWIISLLKAGLKDGNALVSELCFQALIAIQKAKGTEATRSFVSKVVRENKQLQEQAIAEALSTTASWRVSFIQEALEHEDQEVRRLTCRKIQEISGLPDDLFEGLMTHPDAEVRQMATQVLAARGLYRPTTKASGILADTILEEPPTKPVREDYTSTDQKDQTVVNWHALSNALALWRIEIREWKDRKIHAIVAAGKTHETMYFETFKTLLGCFGYNVGLVDTNEYNVEMTACGKMPLPELLGMVSIETGLLG